MFDLPTRDARWTYDDPSGVPDGPLTLEVPEQLRGPVELAAAREGVTAAVWVVRAVRSSLHPASVQAA